MGVRACERVRACVRSCGGVLLSLRIQYGANSRMAVPQPLRRATPPHNNQRPPPCGPCPAPLPCLPASCNRPRALGRMRMRMRMRPPRPRYCSTETDKPKFDPTLYTRTVIILIHNLICFFFFHKSIKRSNDQINTPIYKYTNTQYTNTQIHKNVNTLAQSSTQRPTLRLSFVPGH